MNWGKKSLTVQTVVRCTQSDEHFFPWSSWFKVLFRKQSSRFLSFLTGIMSAVEATQFFMVAKYQHFPSTTRRREWIVLGQDGALGFFRITQRPGCGIIFFSFMEWRSNIVSAEEIVHCHGFTHAILTPRLGQRVFEWQGRWRPLDHDNLYLEDFACTRSLGARRHDLHFTYVGMCWTSTDQGGVSRGLCPMFLWQTTRTNVIDFVYALDDRLQEQLNRTG